jgi:cell wall-associated NlpC family hydrolase
VTRGEMVAQALPGWKGTPFHDRARAKGKGCDCKGLLWGVADELGFPEAQSPYARHTDYSLTKRHGIPSDELLEGFTALFDRVDEVRPGDILLLKLGRTPGHIAICSGEGKAYHAQISPNAYVKEASLRSLLKMFPLHSVWRWRDAD